jgi:hypothetical protein
MLTLLILRKVNPKWINEMSKLVRIKKNQLTESTRIIGITKTEANKLPKKVEINIGFNTLQFILSKKALFFFIKTNLLLMSI